MVSLTREIRFSLNRDAKDCRDQDVVNSWGGWPSAAGLAPYMRLQCTLAGEVDSTTGYLFNVQDIDRKMRELVIVPSCADWQSITPEQITLRAHSQLSSAFPEPFEVTEIVLSTTPSLKYQIRKKDHPMMRLTQQFEFSASHRLHNDSLSEEENRKLFGKCNNPHGHGHNYVVEVTVAGEVDDDSGLLVDLISLERQVKDVVINPLDHRYLNLEIDEFKQLNPSVENIAMVIWNMLEPKLAGIKLDNIRIYETPKTWADYRGATV